MTYEYPLASERDRLATGVRQIPLTRGLVAIVDERDFATVNAYKWYAHRGRNTWYARTEVGGRRGRLRIYMHKLLCDGAEVDHANRNGLDNRRSNLRLLSRAGNAYNVASRGSSGIVGVTWDRHRGKWVAQLTISGKHYNLGRFATKDEALRARSAAFDRLVPPADRPDAPREVIEAAGKAMQRKTHPDAGGSDVEFQEVQAAIRETTEGI
jgi:HNH endonuclease